MKIRHRIPREALEYRPDPISEQYQAEVDRSMAKLATREAQAAKRLQDAEARLTKTTASGKSTRHMIQVARELVEIRRQELLDLQRQMSSAPASGQHRGTGHHRPATPMKTI